MFTLCRTSRRCGGVGCGDGPRHDVASDERQPVNPVVASQVRSAWSWRWACSSRVNRSSVLVSTRVWGLPRRRVSWRTGSSVLSIRLCDAPLEGSTGRIREELGQGLAQRAGAARGQLDRPVTSHAPGRPRRVSSRARQCVATCSKAAPARIAGHPGAQPDPHEPRQPRRRTVPAAPEPEDHRTRRWTAHPAGGGCGRRSRWSRRRARSPTAGAASRVRRCTGGWVAGWEPAGRRRCSLGQRCLVATRRRSGSPRLVPVHRLVTLSAACHRCRSRPGRYSDRIHRRASSGPVSG